MLTDKNRFKYIESFDSLRALAVIFVLLLHGSYGFLKGGWIGVDLFFVLSGYLITSLLYKEYLAFKDVSFSKFYVRRALRLFPPLIASLLIANILWPFTEHPGGNQLLATVSGLFYFSNLISSSLLGIMAHLWSLSVEEHFYVFWPLLTLAFFFKIPLRKRVLFLMILIVSTEVFRIFVFNYYSDSTFGIFTIDPYRFTFCRIDGILMGSLLSFINWKTPKNIENSTKSTLIVTFILCVFL